MEADQTQSFNQKLSQWIASQGFWFQLRHSMSGGGGWAMTFNHLLRLAFKVAMALAVAAGGFSIYLVQRVKSEGFADSLSASLADGLAASEAKVKDFSRNQGEVQLRRVGAEGGEEAFFRSLDAGNVRFKMGLLDGMTGVWEAGTIQAKWLEINVKAGANSAEEAAATGMSFFRQWPSFKFSSIEVDEASIRWGFSQRTAGKIEKSRMVAVRSPDGWRLVFRGGTFSQNWLKDLELKELVVECGRDGVRVTKGDFEKDGGVVKFKDLKIRGGEQPVVSGKVDLMRVPLEGMLPEAVRPFIEGIVSGEFVLSGSTNSLEGIQLEGDVTMGGGNLISLRDRIELLRTLSTVDLFNNYRKVDIDRGSFHLKTGGGAMELTRVDLRAGELMTLAGRLHVRFPKDEEVAGSLKSSLNGQFAPVFDPELSAGQGTKGSSGEIAPEKDAASGGEDAKDMAIFTRRTKEKVEDMLLQEEMARRAQALQCDGGMTITIPGDAFDRSEVLRESFPVDPATGRVPIDVPLQGPLFELTRRQSEEILDLGARY
ncbi:hypothetical protein [Luteolibacter marinus]|uniref:hypothetical protein n=1 Tax=Luteolibacter marinus TaxID=2776705 RepID=UPI001867771B|nr:hypothetical protein [Luteolibacter marinus]